jgi:DNA-binding beta-propeller fold protein YncE
MDTRLRRTALAALAVVAALVGSPPRSWAGEHYQVSKRIPLPGPVSYYDYLTYDEESGRLFVSHGDSVVVVDPEAGKVVATLDGFKKVHGIVVNGRRAFVTDGGADLVKAFELASWKEVGQAPAGKSPDAITFDPASRQVLAVNHTGGSLTMIDPATLKVSATVDFGGKGETAQADGKGTVWLNVEDRDQIARIDSRQKAVTARWPIAPCKTPTGLAFDAKNRRLFAGCEDNQMMVVVDADSGKVITNLPIGARVDATQYDPGTRRIFNSCGDGTLTVIQQESADKYTVLENVPTMKGAKTVALDRRKHRVFVSAKVPAQGAPAGLTPGTLVVLVVTPAP